MTPGERTGEQTGLAWRSLSRVPMQTTQILDFTLYGRLLELSSPQTDWP